ncbi:MAG: SDR family NAD(P)-dependent oxidoreductase [Halioglobus sp.]
MTNPKSALVTGASAGIGKEFAMRLAAQGYSVTCVARRKDTLNALVQELPGQGHVVLCADLSSDEDVARVAACLQDQPVNLLVNNAGFSVLEPFFESPLERQQNILQVNCAAVVTLAHAFLQQAKPGDALINVASVVTYLPTPAQPMYSASKAFIGALSECLWDEHRGRGVYVMGLCPGVTQTDFIKTATGGESDGENLPAALTQTSGQVVSEAMAALEKRKKAIVVTGWVNRMMLLMPRLLTRHRLIKTLAVIGDPDNAL